MTRKLLTLQARVVWAQRGDNVVFWLASGVGGVAFLFALWLAPRAFAPLVERSESAASAVVLLTFGAVGVFQLVAAVRWAVDRLYLASDLELLLSAPVPLRSLYVAKVIEVVARSPVSLAITFVVGYGLARATRSPGGFLLALLAPPVLAATVAACGIALTTAVARVVPPARIKTVLMLVPALLGVGFGFLGQFFGSRPERLEGTDAGPLLDGLSRVGEALRWVPTSWPGSAVTSAATGDPAGIVLAVALSLGTLGGALAVGYVAIRSSFHVTWGRVGEARLRRRRSVLERVALPLPQPVRAMVIKDWRLTVRDLKRAMAVLFPVLFIGVLVVRSIMQAPSEGLGGVIINLLVLVFVLGGSSVQTFVYEGDSLWILRSAPVDAKTFFIAKLATHALPAATIVALLSVVVAILGRLPVVAMVAGVPFAVALLVGLGTLGLSFTLLFGDPSASDPGSNIVLPLVTMVGGGIFVATNVGAVAWLVVASRGLVGPVWLAGSLGHPAVGVVAFGAAAAAWSGGVVLARRAIGRLEDIGFR